MKRILVSHIYLPIIIVMLIFLFTSCTTLTHLQPELSLSI